MKKWIFILIAAIALSVVIWAQASRIGQLRDERDRYRQNSDVLLTEVEQYKVNDSLNASRVGVLELKIAEYERYRAEDASLIRSLTGKNRELQNIVTSQTSTITELRATPKDTVIIIDSIPVPAKTVEMHNEWFDFWGVITEDDFTGRLKNREALVVANTVTYKRFLGFLWKTKQIEDIQTNVVSKNPNTTIISVDAIEIKK